MFDLRRTLEFYGILCGNCLIKKERQFIMKLISIDSILVHLIIFLVVVFLKSADCYSFKSSEDFNDCPSQAHGEIFRHRQEEYKNLHRKALSHM